MADSFEVFWNAYPRRVSRKDAEKVWSRLKPDSALVQKILAALEQQKQQRSWQRDYQRKPGDQPYQYVPYPAGWLRSERWHDEVEVPKPSPLTVVTLTAEQIAHREKVRLRREAEREAVLEEQRQAWAERQARWGR